MTGVKITMIRADASGVKPAERLFEDATDWVFTDEHPGGTLHIIKQGDADATARLDDVKRIAIAEFPASGIESVEFV